MVKKHYAPGFLISNLQVFPEINTIFIHIPKTGGSFLESNILNIVKNLFLTNKIIGNHHTYYEFKRFVKDFHKYKIFCVIRNPYDRLISAFNYLKSSKNTNDIKQWNSLNNPKNISEFVDNIYNKFLSDSLKNKDIYNVHILPQYKFLDIDLKSNKSNCTIIKYETFDKDFLKFIEYYKSNERVYNEMFKIYSKINIKKKYNYNNFLTTKDIKKINIIYEKDFKLLNYEKI